MKDKLAIFDLDGTLFDTKLVNYYAYKIALDKYSIDLGENYFIKKCYGKHYTEFLPELIDDKAIVEAVHRIKKETYINNIDKAKKNYHLFNLIDQMKNNYHIAIVTTASKKNTMDILKFFGYESYFDLVVTPEDITKVKPDPEGFMYAMNYFNISAENTIIFEDSKVGIEAATASGATVFAVEQF